jgi:hypothetical protein
MNYSRIFRDGSARDEALKRRTGVVRAALGMAPKSDTDIAKQRADGKPDDSKAPSSAE